LLSRFPEVERRSVTIPNIVSHEYFEEPSSAARAREIVRLRVNAKALKLAGLPRGGVPFGDEASDEHPQYLLMVSTIEPRKNHLGLLAAWERLRAENPALKLVLVGSMGWHHLGIVRKFQPWMERGDVFMLEEVPSSELRLLYKHARATVCPSFAEGFDLSGVEAMRSGGAVVASDIPAHREVYGEAAEFFNPYSPDDMFRAISGIIQAEQSRRTDLVVKGAHVARQYTFESIMPRWVELLTRIVEISKSPRRAI
jgi:glycosyltransferase involved in cell wall biosynthesis